MDQETPIPTLNGVLLVHAALRQGGADLQTATGRFGETHPELHLPAVPKPVLALLALRWRRQFASLNARAGV
jgi:hypothetical protein